MTILHIAHVPNNPYSGVCNIVPKHIISQQNLINVALLNIVENNNSGVDNQFSQVKHIADLPEPFNKPDLVVFHEIYYPIYLLYGRELFNRKLPYIIVPHGGLTIEAQRIKKAKKKMANLLLFNRFINEAEAIQCLSNMEEQKTMINKKKFLSTNGVNIPKRRKEVFNEGKIEFIYIGRIDIYHKGLDILIDAINLRRDFLKENNCVFSIYGPNENKQYEKIIPTPNKTIIGNCTQKFISAFSYSLAI